MKIAAVAGTWLSVASIVVAQGPSAEWKRQNDKLNRYEGVGVRKDVGAPKPELVGFYASPESVDVVKAKELSVSFFVSEKGPYRLTAREVIVSKYYWMEPRSPLTATPGLNTFSGWKTEDVLQPQGIDVNNLAVLVTAQSQDVVAPALLRPVPARLPEHVDSYRAIFMSEISLSDASFQILKGCGGPSGGVLHEGGRLGRKYGGLAFAIPFSLPVATTQFATLRLKYKVGDVDRDDLDYCFLHVPNPLKPMRLGQ